MDFDGKPDDPAVKMSGLALSRELREGDQTADIPLVLYAGKELPDGGPGPYDCSIAKTAGTDAILATIRALLSKRAAQLPQSPTVVTAE
jgi:hypothetical protein